MPKLAVILAGLGAVVVVGGAVFMVTQNDDKPTGSTNTDKTSQSDTTQTTLDDPSGDYNFFSDPSVTTYPESNAVFGNGQTFTFEYDGSKTANDEFATLSYQLYYVQDDGKVQPIGGGNMEGKGSGTFTTSDPVFNSSASGHAGFFELIGTHSTDVSDSGQITGTNVTLGMYPVKIEISE